MYNIHPLSLVVSQPVRALQEISMCYQMVVKKKNKIRYNDKFNNDGK